MKKFLSVKDVFLDVDKYWDYKLNSFKPEDIAHRSNKRVFWKCQKGHPSYLCSPDKRIYGKCGCPICSNRKIVVGINDFKSQRPDLMLDWDYELNKDINPETLTLRSTVSVNRICHKCNYRWKGTIRDAYEKEINCPKCSLINRGNKKHLDALKKNGGITNKKLLEDWDYKKNEKDPSQYSPNSNNLAYWKCHICGYEWSARISNRLRGRNCPSCSNKILIKGKNDLATKFPELAKERHPTKNMALTPYDVMPGSGRKVWWLCSKGHEYQATPNHRTSGIGTNCPVCNSGRQTSFREQAIFYYVKKMFPDAISRYKPDNFGNFELDIYIPCWNIAIEYDGEARHKKENYSRERRKYQLCKERNIMLYRIKEKAPEELGLDLADYIFSSNDFETIIGITNVINMILERLGLFTPEIYRLNPIDVDVARDRFEIMNYATEVKGSLAEKFPEVAKERHATKNGNLKPSYFKPRSDFKVWWKCSECGNEYEATIGHRTYGTGCPKCGIKKSALKRRNVST